MGKSKAIQPKTQDQYSYGIIINAWIMNLSELTGNEKLLLGRIENFHNKKGCYATDETLRKGISENERSFRKLIKSLAEKGYINRQIKAHNGRRRDIFLTKKSINEITKYHTVQKVPIGKNKQAQKVPNHTVQKVPNHTVQKVPTIKENIKENINNPPNPPKKNLRKYWGMDKQYEKEANIKGARSTEEILNQNELGLSKKDINNLKNNFRCNHLNIVHKVNQIKQDTTIKNKRNVLIAYFKK